MYAWAAISIGLLGSLHCVGMCGPIALALPVDRSSAWKQWTGIFLYNAGRILVYATIGLLFGTIGMGFNLAGLQGPLSITLGVLILIFVLFPNLSFYHSRFNILLPFINKIRKSVYTAFKRQSLLSVFTIGLFNGLLPCGLVYLAVIGSVATGNAWEGSMFMMLFGIGTLPAMVFVAAMANLFNPSVRSKARILVPVFVSVMAVMLILRGMNLGIPYLSPETKTNNGMHMQSCCHK